MKRKLILASHGKFASGILSSLNLICGVNNNIEVLDCYVSENFDLNCKVKKIMKENENLELIVVTDLFGGSVNNEFLKYIEQANYYLVAGMNLPFLVEFVTQFEYADSLSNLIEQTLSTSKLSIQFCNQTIQQKIEEEEF